MLPGAALPSRCCLPLPCLQQANRVIQGGRLEVPPAERLPGDAPTPEGLAAYTALLHGCWDQEPGNRPTFPHIVFDLRWGTCHCRRQPVSRVAAASGRPHHLAFLL